MAIDLGVSLVGTFALYGMLQVLKDIVVEVLGLANPTVLTGNIGARRFFIHARCPSFRPSARLSVSCLCQFLSLIETDKCRFLMLPHDTL